MEEILASIRRIIAEDNDTGKPAEEEAEAPSSPPPPPPLIQEPEPERAPPMAFQEDVLELTEVVEDEPEPEPAYEPPEPFQPRRFEMPPDEPTEGLVSRATAAASSAAFAAMHSRARDRRSGDVYLGDGAVTLEELVKELLRPQLQEWLDDHLPGLVERLVREEIERLARSAK
ncbi:MAG TPA: DUF2497 domain-containing protein [Aliidongia sp.]|uniref:DUF2497 domain-containing protein n=1 Tax=Aliidongia sp. TaxID=1914230 RepID=UPI002DDCAA50|nr:DUF2497 domain-containing protein [Aliidongia sp.]HEV2678107.1 DUF2497 domain-containing protein [Aliidongia sp.]